MNHFLLTMLSAVALIAAPRLLHAGDLPPGVTRMPVVFSGGYETEGVDRGRPVKLIAAALGVKTEEFRQAFSGVHPAGPGRGPTGDEARRNKAVLMAALAPDGITNERLDEVSNYYRYRRESGELWTHVPAVANALVKDGKVTWYEIVNPGAGYSSTPKVSVPGASNAAPAVVEMAYGKDFKTNGSIQAILVP